MTGINLDLLSIWPGHMSDSDGVVAMRTYHFLVTQGHSVEGIARLAEDHALENHERIFSISAKAMKPGDSPSFLRLSHFLALNMMKNPLVVGDFIEMAARARLDIYSSCVPQMYNINAPSVFPLTTNTGEKVSLKSINYACQTKAMILFLMAGAIRADDADSVAYLLQVPKIAKVFDSTKISTWLTNFKIDPNGHIAQRYLTFTNGFAPKSYTQYVLEMLAISNIKDDRTAIPCLPEFSKKVGHEVLLELMGKDSKAAMRVMRQLIIDGADWYIAFEQKRLGRASYFDLAGRKVEISMELGAVMFGAKNNGCKPLAQALIQTLEKEDFIRLAYDQKAADQLWREWRLPYLVDRVSERYRAEILESDLGL